MVLKGARPGGCAKAERKLRKRLVCHETRRMERAVIRSQMAHMDRNSVYFAALGYAVFGGCVSH